LKIGKRLKLIFLATNVHKYKFFNSNKFFYLCICGNPFFLATDDTNVHKYKVFNSNYLFVCASLAILFLATDDTNVQNYKVFNSNYLFICASVAILFFSHEYTNVKTKIFFIFLSVHLWQPLFFSHR
jgi:hypothetical protein